MIPVLKTRLPSYSQLEPYLQRIDTSSQYSNCGPLYLEYKDKLSSHFGSSSSAYLPLASGNSAILTALVSTAILLDAEPSQLKVAMPSWSFPATLQAALLLGLILFYSFEIEYLFMRLGHIIQIYKIKYPLEYSSIYI